MSRIGEAFKKSNGKKLLIPFITAGDPDLDTTIEIIGVMVKNGADMIELGIPFSDPLADGATIQRSYNRALKKGISLRKIIAAIPEIRQKTSVPIILMSSYNLIYSYGDEALVRDASQAGVDGLIIPDLLPEDADELISCGQKYGVDTIFLTAPTSNEERIKLVAQRSRGFIYYVSLAGITGTKSAVAAEVKEGIERVKRFSDTPVAVGFGISTPEQAGELSLYADAVIIGSANVKIVEENLNNKELMLKKVGNFIAKLKKEI